MPIVRHCYFEAKNTTIMNRREILRYAALATGAAVSAPLASAFLTSCESDAAVATPEVVAAEPYSPTFFNQEQYDYITKFADTIIPRTDTPGASDVGVPETIDRMVGAVYSEEAQEETKAGLNKLMAKMDADNAASQGFKGLDEGAMLIYLQDQDLHYKNPETDWETLGEEEMTLRDTYFALKQATIAYYFGSEEVATNQLAYLPIPGEYIPCGDLEELTGGVAWAI
ncbi:hypothetical protein CEQ90_11175 [Lewinellaceae bacterium SD302]|nr:hypothetical protein CEQ90_11175 [Lewinellaceae bacterium SD302]